MKLNKGEPFLNLNHKKVLKAYNGTKFINEMQVKDKNGNYTNFPVSVYYAKTPDLDKGHKPYFFLFKEEDRLFVGGLTVDQMEDNRYQKGIYCHDCGDVIYSKYRHDYTKCTCGNSSVDGGKDYLKFSGRKINIVMIDLLTDEIREIN